MSFYLVIIIILALLAISDLVVGVSNDAVNFLNSAVGSKAAHVRTIFIVAALGIVFGCTFSSGMMEVARKGIFHPELFYFNEIILLFLAVMVTDVILLDTFNTFGMPTSTTVSIVFELLGAAVGLSLIKIWTDPNAVELAAYINSGKALAIIAGILLSVVVAFSAGVLIQFLTRIMFSFNYKKRIKYLGAIWGGLAIAAITYFILIKGAKGASFMSADLKDFIKNNAFYIISLSFVGWTIVLQFIIWFTKIDIFKLIVLVGTFALAMAFAGNDLVNFIGVPLAGYNSYELYMASGGADANEFLMEGLAGKVKTPTLLLILAGLIMTVTLWTSKKAKRVIQTSLDLGRQYEGEERFSSYAVSRSLVRGFSKLAKNVNGGLSIKMKNALMQQFDETEFIEKQKAMGDDAPSFDLVRAAVTLMVASILIAIGTALKLPLSTTYVTFMVFMGTSLADGAWGRESAVYRVSGVISVIGGWFFTAFSAFTVAFIVVILFYYGGVIAIVGIILLAVYLIFRTHSNPSTDDDTSEFEEALVSGVLTKDDLVKLSHKHMNRTINGYTEIMESTIEGLEKEDLPKLVNTSKKLKSLLKKTAKMQYSANQGIDKIEDDEMEAGHMYLLIAEYLNEMGQNVNDMVRLSLDHIDNNHKPFISDQIEDLTIINNELKKINYAVLEVFETLDPEKAAASLAMFDPFVLLIRNTRKKQIKRIKAHIIGTRNSMLYLNHLAEYRNMSFFTSRLVKVCYDLIINPESTREE